MSINAQLCPLEQHSKLIVSGPDAFKFLQGQCTCDLNEANENKIILGAHCNPKGRVLFNFILIKSNENEYTLRMRQNIICSALQNLKKYSTFFKVEMAVSELPNFALLGSQYQEGAPKSGQWLQDGELTVLNHGGGFVEYWGGAPSIDEPVIVADTGLADLHLIQQGIVEIEAATTEKLTPHDINFQFIGGISFSKGCYTGQEVVARMHYKAALKKHCYHVKFNTLNATEIGHALLDRKSSLPNTPKAVALVVAAANDTLNDVTHALIITTDSAFESQAELVDEKTQAKISWATLPYAIT